MTITKIFTFSLVWLAILSGCSTLSPEARAAKKAKLDAPSGYSCKELSVERDSAVRNLKLAYGKKYVALDSGLRTEMRMLQLYGGKYAQNRYYRHREALLGQLDTNSWKQIRRTIVNWLNAIDEERKQGGCSD